MIHNIGHDQRSDSVEYTDFGGPFYRMGFTCGGSEGTDAWHIEADRKDEGKSLCFRKVGR